MDNILRPEHIKEGMWLEEVGMNVYLWMRRVIIAIIPKKDTTKELILEEADKFLGVNYMKLEAKSKVMLR